MKVGIVSVGFVIFYLVVGLSFSFGQGRALILAGKQASVLVELPEHKGTATAFCIHASGLFVTNNHVINKLPSGKSLQLVADAGLATERVVEAKVVRIDTKNDLALLKVDSATEVFPTLPLGGNSDSFETMSVSVFGYPFGRLLAIEKGGYPSISVNTGKITSLRYDKKEIELVQLDASLNPGNSGGAVLDDQGRVIGIVSFGVQASGVNFAIPVEKLKAMVETPRLDAVVPNLENLANIRNPKVVATLTPVLREIEEPTIEFWIKRGLGDATLIPMKRLEGYRFEAAVSASEDFGIDKLVLKGKIDFEAGSIQTNISNEKITTDSEIVWLSEINSIDSNAIDNPTKAVVYLKNGKLRTAEKSNLPKIRINLGNYPATILLSRTTGLQIDEVVSQNISYYLIVKNAGKELFRKTDEELKSDGAIKETVMEISSAISASSIPKSVHKDLLVPKTRIPIQGKLSNVCIAGGGRFVALSVAERNRLLLFDTQSRRIVKELQLDGDKTLVTGTQDHLILFQPETKMCELYRLSDFTKQLAYKLSVSETIVDLAAGYASQGPLFVCREGSDKSHECTLVAMDLMSGKELPVKNQNHALSRKAADNKKSISMRVSANGLACGFWTDAPESYGLETVSLHDDEMHFRYVNDFSGFAAPSPDGYYIMTSASGVLDIDLKNKRKKLLSNQPSLPTSHPRLYLKLQPDVKKNDSSDRVNMVKSSIFAIGTEVPIVDTPSLDLGGRTKNYVEGFESRITLDKRVHLFVAGSSLVTIPFSNDAIEFQGFNLRNAFIANESKPFFVASNPPRTFDVGLPFSYQLEVETSNKSVTFELTEGPTGMEVSAGGKITWNVPETHPNKTEDIIVSISGGNTHHVFESFTLTRTTP